VVTPGQQRAAADYLGETYGISQRRACRVLRRARSTLRYQPRPRLGEPAWPRGTGSRLSTARNGSSGTGSQANRVVLDLKRDIPVPGEVNQEIRARALSAVRRRTGRLYMARRPEMSGSTALSRTPRRAHIYGAHNNPGFPSRTHLGIAEALSLEVVMGPEFADMAVNLGRNLLEGGVRIIQAVMAKSRAWKATLAWPAPQPAAAPSPSSRWPPARPGRSAPWRRSARASHNRSPPAGHRP
jgi:hypothetical protein